MRVPTSVAVFVLGVLALPLAACSGGSATVAATTSAAVPVEDAPAHPTGSAGAASPPGASTSAPSHASVAGDIDACSLLSIGRASSLVGKTYSAAVGKTIAAGQDQCSYTASDNSSPLNIIIYQPTSGVTWQMMNSVLADTGAVTAVSGVGDKAMVGQIELDAQTGNRLVAVQGAGGSGGDTKAVAVTKAVIAGLR